MKLPKRKKFIFIAVLTVIGLIFIRELYYKDYTYFLCPVDTGGEVRIRRDNMGDGRYRAKRRNGRLHAGLDILAPMGSAVMAARGGTAEVLSDPKGYGVYIEIEHAGDLKTLYAHLEKSNIKRVKRVRQGEVIGFVGNTGNANQRLIKPHLHFEASENGSRCDPMKYLR